ncbi:hypothetical protein VNO77_32235 [Canavalia gladiata]|uniref:Uncharacterized protein n=1 Tax=Canavalia gladiata TaxID=3824 RepID=A0AAN9KR29_CANGL
MKRKKWSELEEQTLLSKYSELLRSGTLAKLKTREKKFKPVAEHVNAIHHLRDPSSFPFKWSWRDVSIKVQNMRHQYLGVKQKIRLSPHHFNWKDGPNHWENFLKYKEVFGDVQLLETPKPNCHNNKLGFEIGSDEEDDDDDDDDEEEEEEEEDDADAEDCAGEDAGEEASKLKRIVAGVLQLREAVVKREERRREREFRREKGEAERERKRKEAEFRRERRREWLEDRDLELEEWQLRWARRELEKRVRLERELETERRWRKRVEERMEEEEMEWRQRMVAMQVEHEKQMMQMHAEACQNQMQILGIMTRLLCQFFGSGTDGLGSGLGALPPQVLHHAGGLGSVKPDANSPSEFI